MRFSLSHLICLAAATSLVEAEGFTKHKVGETSLHALLGRQSNDGYCSGSSCAACFGDGNIVCSGNSCFNPSAGEQCCADGGTTHTPPNMPPLSPSLTPLPIQNTASDPTPAAAAPPAPA